MAHRKAEPAIHEFDFIRALARKYGHRAPGLVQGIGDDAAVLAAPTSAWWHLTTDLLAEGVHFDLKSASPESVGYRAAMANLSDLAAMGAVPHFLLISLAVPKRLQRRQLDDLYAGLMKACRPHRVTLIGGDTSASQTGLFLSITLIGTTKKQRALFRHGASVGDGIYVTGTLGDSLAGLHLLSRDKSRSFPKSAARLPQSVRRFLVDRHLRPTARIAEGQWLNKAGLATSAIDVSDGLSGDLLHICEESRVGAEIDLDTIPISPACQAYASAARTSPTTLALTGGEDYELLFTASPTKQRLIERQARTYGFHITRIGTIRPQRYGIQMTSGGQTRPMPMTSYEHFR